MKYFAGTVSVRHCDIASDHTVIIHRQNFHDAMAHLNGYCQNYYDGEKPEKDGESFWFPYSMVSVLPERLIEIDDVGKWKQEQFDNAII